MRYPKLVRIARTPARVVIESSEPNEYNERVVICDRDVLCNYQDTASIRFDGNKQSPEVVGCLLIDGDPFPEASVIAAGYVDVFGMRMAIAKGAKARNPDGTVNYTRLDVI